MKTVTVKASDVKREWHTIDASDEVLGKLAARAANLLMGKHKPLFARNADVGDFVIVTNAAKIQVTGDKTVAENVPQPFRLSRRVENRQSGKTDGDLSGKGH